MGEGPTALRPLEQVTVIGTGLLGASLMLALRRLGYAGRIWGVGRREATLAQARRLEGWDGLTTHLDQALTQTTDTNDQLAVLAAPLGHFEPLFRTLADADRPGLMITDVGSTKASVCAMAAAHLPRPGRFVGSHPMAGSDQQGPAAARADLFAGRPCIMTPLRDSNRKAVAQVEALWLALGMRVVRMTPTEHDQKVATISHLPHAVAALLVDLAVQRGALGVASTGFRDTTRVAAGDAKLWRDIFLSNREAVCDAIDAFAGRLASLREALRQGDDAALTTMLEQARVARSHWTPEAQGDA